jgi:hypothetical protein
MSMFLHFDPGLRAQISDDELIDAVLSEHPDVREELEQMAYLEDDASELYDAFFEAYEVDEETLLADAA